MRKGHALVFATSPKVRAVAAVAAVAALLLFARGNELLLGASVVGVGLLVVSLAETALVRGRRRSGLIAALVASALIVVPLLPVSIRLSGLERVANAILDAGIANGADIYIAEEFFGAGSELVIVPDVGDEIHVQLEGDAHFAVVDDEPSSKFGHPVHYVIVPTSGKPRVIDHEWLPTVNGIHWGIDGEWEVRGHRVYGLTDVEDPFPRVRISVAPSLIPPVAAAGKKIALVVDGGHLQHEWRDPFARKLDDDSRAVASLLEDLGYDVRRFGGYRGSVVPAARVDDVKRELVRIAGQVSAGDEVVVFLNGHGTRTGEFVLRGREGSREVLSYAELARALADIPGAVPVRVLIDACFSGTAVEPLSRRDNTVVSTATDATHTAPGGLDARPTFSAVVATAAKNNSADINGDGHVSIDESLAVAGRAFQPLGSRLIATKGAPTVPTAELAVAPPAAPIAAGPAAPQVPPPAVAPPAQPAVQPPAAQPAQSRAPAAQAPAPTLVPVALPPTPTPLRFVAGAPPQATAGQPYQHSFCTPTPATATSACGPFPQTTNPTGGSPPYHFQLGSGVGFPPTGMSVGKDGILTGTPSAPGTYRFEVCAVDLSANSVCQTVTMTVTAPSTPSVEERWAGRWTGPYTGTASTAERSGPCSRNTAGNIVVTITVSGSSWNVSVLAPSAHLFAGGACAANRLSNLERTIRATATPAGDQVTLRQTRGDQYYSQTDEVTLTRTASGITGSIRHVHVEGSTSAPSYTLTTTLTFTAAK